MKAAYSSEQQIEPAQIVQLNGTKKLNSIIFHTSRLNEIRAFYEEKLKLSVDAAYTEEYVAYQIAGFLLSFEMDECRTDLGTVVLNVEDPTQLQMHLERNGVVIHGAGPDSFIVEDPDGRLLIFEPFHQT